MNLFRAGLRELALGEITRLTEIYGSNSFEPELVEARANLWALEWLDSRSPEHLQRLQNMPAVKGLAVPSGVTTRTSLPLQSTRLKAIGQDIWREIYREDTIVDSNPVNATWTGSELTFKEARGAWVAGRVVIESNTDNAETFTASFNQLSGPENIQNTSQVYDNKLERPIRLFMPVYVPINGLSHFAADSYDDRHKAPRFQSTANPPTAATREALGKHDVNGLVDMAGIGYTHSVEPNESFCLWFRVWIDKDRPAGDYTGVINLVDSAAGEINVPVTITASSLQLSDTNFIEMVSYIASGPAGERLSGNLFPNPGTDDYDAEVKMVNAAARALRENRIHPIFDEADNEPVPNADQEARLLGTLYDGDAYLGPARGLPLTVMFWGVYHQWANWDGVGGSDAVEDAATIPAALQQHIDDVQEWLTENAPNATAYAYIFDEADTEELLLNIEKWAGWFSDFRTFATTGSTLAPPNGLNYNNVIATAPSVDHISIAAPVMPTSAESVLTAHKSISADKEVSIYNGLSPMDVSYQLDEVGNAGLLRWLVRLKHHLDQDLCDLHFYWGSTEWRNNEGAGVFSGAPEGTYVDPGDNRGRPNLRKTGNSFGQSDEDVDRSFDGHSGYLYCEGDGHLLIPGVDFFFPDDSFGIEDALPTARLFKECAGIQAAQALYQAYQTDTNVLTQLKGEIPVSFWELGVHRDGESDEDVSYFNTPNPLHSIDNNDLVDLIHSVL